MPIPTTPAEKASIQLQFAVSPAGLIGRQCPSLTCRQHFQVQPLIPLNLDRNRICPYCGWFGQEADFWSEPQLDELLRCLNGSIPRSTRDLSLMQVLLNPGSVMGHCEPPWNPKLCDQCGKVSATAAEASFCPDCGWDHNSSMLGAACDLPGASRAKGYLALLQGQAENLRRRSEELMRESYLKVEAPMTSEGLGRFIGELKELLQRSQPLQGLKEKQKLAKELRQLARCYQWPKNPPAGWSVALASLTSQFPESAELLSSSFWAVPRDNAKFPDLTGLKDSSLRRLQELLTGPKGHKIS
ncbi:MAG: hypothetical protein RRB13_14210 [bacterium]|nr:hypothetical protein [bacterium]